MITLCDFIISHHVCRLVSEAYQVLTKYVREGTIQAYDQMRGSTLKKWKHQLKKRLVGGKDTSRTRALVAKELQVAQSHLESVLLPKCCRGVMLQAPKEVYSAAAKMWKARHPISHICKWRLEIVNHLCKKFQPYYLHILNTLHFQLCRSSKSCHRSLEGNRSSNPKHFTLRRRVYKLALLFPFWLQ